ncbi:MAG TPA: hypothetical protein VEC37_07065, partial [Bacillota bacterium]|nr:hypothetical protein [Bacillota bacterium]
MVEQRGKYRFSDYMVLVVVGGLLVWGFGNAVMHEYRYYHDLAAAYSGRVIQRGMEGGESAVFRYYLVIDSATGQRKKRYCTYEGYRQCRVGMIITKKQGRAYDPLPKDTSEKK